MQTRHKHLQVLEFMPLATEQMHPTHAQLWTAVADCQSKLQFTVKEANKLSWLSKQRQSPAEATGLSKCHCWLGSSSSQENLKHPRAFTATLKIKLLTNHIAVSSSKANLSTLLQSEPAQSSTEASVEILTSEWHKSHSRLRELPLSYNEGRNVQLTLIQYQQWNSY